MQYKELFSSYSERASKKQTQFFDSLSDSEMEYRDRLIAQGLKEFHELIKRQKSSEMYYFYEGSIEGFEECRKYSRFLDFENRLEELNALEHREISCSSLDDEELRHELGIYDPSEETDINEVWKMKGIRTQVNFVYRGLFAFRLIVRLRKPQ